MDLSPLRTLTLSLNLGAHGVPATVTRPVPDDTPIATTAIWQTAPREEQRPYGTDFQVTEPRRELILPRDVLPTVPRGTVISAPEQRGGVTKTWRVDEKGRLEADHWRVLVVATS